MGFSQFAQPKTKASPRVQEQPRRQSPAVFQPPASGGGYYGRWYRWEQALHYTGPSYIAIQAWISEIAGGEDPLIGRRRPKQAPIPGKAIRKSLSPHHEFEALELDDPMLEVFERPNNFDVGYDLWQYHTLFKQLQGISYWWIRRNGFGIPKEIWVVPPHWIQLMTDRNGDPWYYWVQAPWGHIANIPAEEVVTFVSPSPLNPRWEGWAVNQAVAQWIDSYESLIRMRLAVWKTGAVPSFHVALGEAYMDPDDAFLARFYSKWFARFQGEDKSGLPLITGADVEVKTLDGHRPADALLATNESEQQTRDNTFAAYRVPGAIVGLTKDMTYGSVQASKEAFREYSVDSELKYTGEVITQRIIRPTPGYEDGILYWNKRAKGDPDYKLRQQAQGIEKGYMTPNEVRTENGMEPFPRGGDNPLVGGVEMPWVREAQEEPMAAAFNRALSEGSGSNGGFSVNGNRKIISKGFNPIKELQKVGERLAASTDPAPMPGYGQIFLKENGSGEVWYVGGDGDEDGFVDLVERELKKIQGIDDVTCEAEAFPPKGQGWIQVYPEEREWSKKKAISHYVAGPSSRQKIIALEKTIARLETVVKSIQPHITTNNVAMPDVKIDLAHFTKAIGGVVEKAMEKPEPTVNFDMGKLGDTLTTALSVPRTQDDQVNDGLSRVAEALSAQAAAIERGAMAQATAIERNADAQDASTKMLASLVSRAEKLEKLVSTPKPARRLVIRHGDDSSEIEEV